MPRSRTFTPRRRAVGASSFADRARRAVAAVGIATRAVAAGKPEVSLLVSRAYAALEAAAPDADAERVRSAWRRLVVADASRVESPFSARPEPKLPTTTIVGTALLARALRDARDATPLVFPRRGAAPPLDARRLALRAARVRLDRALGACLSREGSRAFAIDVARALWRDERDARDLVRELEAAGRRREALDVAREAVAAGDAVGAEELRPLIDRLSRTGGVRRAELKRLETRFLAHPTKEAYAALMAAVVPEQRGVVASRTLGALQRVGREPDLVFGLYLDEGRLLDADGMAATRRLAAETLTDGAERVLDAAPGIAAGWLLIAALRTADDPDQKQRQKAPERLLRVRDLCAEIGRSEDFRRALRLLRSRHADRPRFLALLRRSGL
jgi:hypothetical protein